MEKDKKIPLISFMTGNVTEKDIEKDIRDIIRQAKTENVEITAEDIIEKIHQKRKVDSERALHVITSLRSDKKLLQIDEKTGVIEVNDQFWSDDDSSK
ncbi:MAG: hypothetical protein JXR95_14025 [Deltaproteobacteria bacterium]|nr:hypothetical protein [Deltaproteobacteria bacterium]